MSGFQSGIVAGSHNVRALPGGYYMGTIGGGQRGAISPGSSIQSSQCENDNILIGQWFGVGNRARNAKEVKDLLNSGPNAPIVAFYMKVDGSVIDHNHSANKTSVLEPFGRITLDVFDVVFEPFYFSPGNHSASIVFQIDIDCLRTACDGISDYDETYSSVFEVLDSNAQAPQRQGSSLY